MRNDTVTPFRPRDQPLNVLFIDDYADTANTMVELTRMFGHSARAVYSTKAALEAISA
jgi:CheY-like chemotaxis protein